MQAQKLLGDKYLHGQGVAQSTSAAIRWYQQSAENGYLPAKYILGYLFQAGLGTRRSDHNAIIWYHQAAQADHVDAQYNLATLLLTTRELPQAPKQAFNFFQLAANAGDADATNNRGYLQELGIGTEKNLGRARQYYLIAAQKNHVKAQYNLGRLLLDTQPLQLAEAQCWLERSARQGFAPAMALLGQSYYESEIPNYQTAYYWMAIAKAFGNKAGRVGMQIVEKHLTPVQIQNLQTEILRFRIVKVTRFSRSQRKC